MLESNSSGAALARSPSDYITTKQAAAIARRSENCIRLWIERYGIGRKVVGRYEVNRAALEQLLSGTNAATDKAA